MEFRKGDIVKIKPRLNVGGCDECDGEDIVRIINPKYTDKSIIAVAADCLHSEWTELRLQRESYLPKISESRIIKLVEREIGDKPETEQKQELEIGLDVFWNSLENISI